MAPAHQPSFALKGLQWDNASRRMYAEICPAPDPTAQVDLLLCGRRLPMARSQERRALSTCYITDGLDTATVFASAIVTKGQDSSRTASRWVDDIAALEHASHAARLLEPFKTLDRSASSAEQRQMLDELQEVAQALFNDTASFRDPGFVGADRKQESDGRAEPVNPTDLVVHLDESQGALPHLVSAGPGSLSLTGILRLLFEAETDEGRAPAAAGDEDIDEGQMPDAPPPPKQPDRKEKAGEEQARPPIEARFRDRLAMQIDTFLTEMSAASFAGCCTATQMVQAVSFPLAVALRGRRRGWVTDELAEKWALEIFSILFRGTGPGSGGLLRAVEQRYVQNGQKDTFEDVVGDGTLCWSWLRLWAARVGTASAQKSTKRLHSGRFLPRRSYWHQRTLFASLACLARSGSKMPGVRGPCRPNSESASRGDRMRLEASLGCGDARLGTACDHPQAGRFALAREGGMGGLP